MAEIPARPDSATDGFQPGRLWSLWEMMNFKIGGLRTIQGEISALITLANANSERAPFPEHDPRHLKDQETIADIARWATEIAEMAKRGVGYLKCPHIDHAIESLAWWAKGERKDWQHLRAKAIALRDAIDTELKQYFYYQYPKPKAQIVNAYEEDWKPALAAFPSIKSEAFRAADCYGLGHNVASVFHSMRILETGLKAMAADVGLSSIFSNGTTLLSRLNRR